MPKRRQPEKKPPIMLAIREDVLTKLIDLADVMPDIDDELESARATAPTSQPQRSSQVLVETGRAVGFLHMLATALCGGGYRRWYAEGALAPGRVFHALARDASSGRT